VKRSLASLQVLRGLAALAVAFYHTHLIYSQPQGGGVDLLGAWAGAIVDRGWLGVNFFFVLSGFIIAHAHGGDIGQPARARRYLWRRFSRVYPMYWVVLAGFLALAALGFGKGQFSWAPTNLAAAISLVLVVPHPSLPLQVAWTLFFEVAFYAMFVLLILHRWLGGLAMALWLGAVTWIALVRGDGDPGWYLHAWNLYFAAGMAARWLYGRIAPRYGPWLLAAGLLGLGALLAAGQIDMAIALAQRQPGKMVLLALPFSLILLGAALWESEAQDWRAPALLALLGDASYAIYLVHSPVVNHRFGHGAIPGLALYGVTLFASVAAGVAAHLWVEKPLLRALRYRQAKA